jgi:GNAT superfamily N-acetyltransferase
MSLSVTVLDPRQTADFQRVFEICAATIDRSEQKTEAELRACFLNPAYRFMAAREAGVIVGCAICYAPPEQGFWLLEYIAVDPGFQGRGLGARLFDACCAVVGPDAVGLLEVDAPEPQKPGALARQRRLAFYRRLGCRRLDGLAYILPLDHHGPPPPMWLLVHAPADVARLPATQIRAWLERIYADVYARPADDPRLARMTAGLSGSLAIVPFYL